MRRLWRRGQRRIGTIGCRLQSAVADKMALGLDRFRGPIIRYHRILSAVSGAHCGDIGRLFSTLQDHEIKIIWTSENDPIPLARKGCGGPIPRKVLVLHGEGLNVVPQDRQRLRTGI
jgi:hypothetical protein